MLHANIFKPGHLQPAVGMTDLLKLSPQKCLCVCMFVCTYTLVGFSKITVSTYKLYGHIHQASGIAAFMHVLILNAHEAKLCELVAAFTCRKNVICTRYEDICMFVFPRTL